MIHLHKNETDMRNLVEVVYLVVLIHISWFQWCNSLADALLPQSHLIISYIGCSNQIVRPSRRSNFSREQRILSVK